MLVYVNLTNGVFMSRLFVFAGYDPQGVIDDTLLYYLNALSKFGDIVLTFDCDVAPSEAKKLKSVKNLLHVEMKRHNEYDFGSYKRGFQYADKNRLLDKYDWIYFVNDSVYGPFNDIGKILTDLEGRSVDLVGMVDFYDKFTPRHVQSWFFGISQKLAKTDMIKNFMNSVRHQETKEFIILKYEVRMSQLILQAGYSMSVFIEQDFNNNWHNMYQAPMEMVKKGMPFVKKNGLKVLNGLQFLFSVCDEDLVMAIYRNEQRLGKQTALKYKLQYENLFRLTMFSLPIIKIVRQEQANPNLVAFKVYLFDVLQVFKISKRRF